MTASRRKPTGRAGRPPGPARDRTERRDELLDAAVRVIRRVGADASMDKLAAEAGLTKPILYAHFRDKAGLTDALAQRFVVDLQTDLLKSVVDVARPREVVRTTIDTFLRFVEEDPELYRFLVQGAEGTGRGIIRQRLVLEIGNQMAMVIGVGLRRAGAEVRSAELWTFAILGAVFAGTEWWLGQTKLGRDEFVDDLTDLLWSGIGGVGLGRLDGPLIPPEVAATLAATLPPFSSH